MFPGPAEVIPQMLEKWEQGSQVVCEKRIGRAGETIFKKFPVELFYSLLWVFTYGDKFVPPGGILSIMGIFGEYFRMDIDFCKIDNLHLKLMVVATFRLRKVL
mgnify:CR=1 FL=1